MDLKKIKDLRGNKDLFNDDVPKDLEFVIADGWRFVNSHRFPRNIQGDFILLDDNRMFLPVKGFGDVKKMFVDYKTEGVAISFNQDVYDSIHNIRHALVVLAKDNKTLYNFKTGKIFRKFDREISPVINEVGTQFLSRYKDNPVFVDVLSKKEIKNFNFNPSDTINRSSQGYVLRDGDVNLSDSEAFSFYDFNSGNKIREFDEQVHKKIYTNVHGLNVLKSLDNMALINFDTKERVVNFSVPLYGDIMNLDSVFVAKNGESFYNVETNDVFLHLNRQVHNNIGVFTRGRGFEKNHNRYSLLCKDGFTLIEFEKIY